jgi:SAM-dependent methyltransferase
VEVPHPRVPRAEEIEAAAAASTLRSGPAFSVLADADELRFREEVEPGLRGAGDVVPWLVRKELPHRLADTLQRAGVMPAGTVVELGAGSCWLSGMLARFPQVDRVLAVEFSRRRLEELAPVALAALGAPATKVERVLADFNQPGVPPASADLVATDAAFHHASDPGGLARVAHELLRPGGTVLLFREPTLAVLRRTRDHGVEGEHGEFEHEYTARGYLDHLYRAGFQAPRAVPVAGGFRRRRQRWAGRRPLAWLNGIAFAEYAYVARRSDVSCPTAHAQPAL